MRQFLTEKLSFLAYMLALKQSDFYSFAYVRSQFEGCWCNYVCVL